MRTIIVVPPTQSYLATIDDGPTGPIGPATSALVNGAHSWQRPRKGHRLSALKSPAENDEVYRIDVPCAVLGLPPPPCPLTGWVVRTSSLWSVLAQTPAGRAAHVARWITAVTPAQIYIEQGLAPTSLWIRFEQPFEALSRLLDGLIIKRLEMTPAGTATAFISGPPDRAGRLAAMVRDASPELTMREAIQVAPEAPLTRRQREALSLAVALGYYEVPRRANLHEVAQRMGMSAGAASELLRRGERILIGGFFDDCDAPQHPAASGPRESAGPRGIL